MKLLLISNSTNAGEEYLSHAMPMIQSFLGKEKREILFIPYAAITFSFDNYLMKVREKFSLLGHKVNSVHLTDDPASEVDKAECIVIGGGNTFHLLNLLQTHGLLDPIRKKVKSGIPYIGWSAGANVACPTICTTNDMPVVEPESLKALNLVPFQINPHYLDAHPEGHAGETREQRLQEYIEVNPERYVAGLREGSALQFTDGKLNLLGTKPVRIFKKAHSAWEVEPAGDLNFLLQ